MGFKLRAGPCPLIHMDETQIMYVWVHTDRVTRVLYASTCMYIHTCIHNTSTRLPEILVIQESTLGELFDDRQTNTPTYLPLGTWVFQ